MSIPIQLPLKLIAETAQKLGYQVGPWSPENKGVPPYASHAVVHELAVYLQKQRPQEPLGVLIGSRLPPHEFGLPSVIARHCPTLGEAVQRYIHFQTLAAPNCIRLEPDQEIRGVSIVAPDAMVEPELEESLAFRCVFPLAFGIQNLRRLAADREVQAASVSVMQPDDGFGDYYRDYFGGEVQFEAEENRLDLHSHTLDRPVVGADPKVLPYLEELAIKEAEQFGLRPGVDENFGKLLRIKLKDAILEGSFELADLARTLGMSDRTLQRRLKEEALSYRTLVTEARQELAIELLRAPEHTLDQVASLLGYRHLASFNRAFKRWTGHSPGHFREMLATHRD